MNLKIAVGTENAEKYRNKVLDKNYTLNDGYDTDGANFFAGARYAPGK
jgi:hypothetical protein